MQTTPLRSHLIVVPAVAVGLLLLGAPASRGAAHVTPHVDAERVVDLGAGSYTMLAAGGVYNDQLGNDMAVGDVNGDQMGDLVLGAHWSGGAGRNIVGRAYVLFGRPTWPRIVDLGNRSAADWSVRGAGREARLGSAVAVGDVGGDPTEDLIAGSLLADPFDQVDGGAAVVLFGGPDVAGDVDLEDTAPDVLFAGDSRTQGTDQLGSDAQVCDLNGDDSRDIVVAAANRGDGHGAVFVWWGPMRSGSTVNLRSTPADWTLLGAHERAWFGSNIACGDVDGDEIDDLVVSVGRTAVPGAPLDAGAVLIFLGGPGVGGTIDATYDRAFAAVVGWPGAMLGMARSTIRSARGRPLHVADVTGDEHPDLLIGSPLGNRQQGSLVMLAGPLEGGAIDLRLASHLLVTTERPGARLGWSVATGHLDDDGRLDLVVAAPHAAAGDLDKGGIVAGLRGPLATTGQVELDDASAFVVLGPERSAGNAGISLVLHDVTGDEASDLAIGFPDAAPLNRKASGAVYLLSGPLLDRRPSASPTPSASVAPPSATHPTPATPTASVTARPSTTATAVPGLTRTVSSAATATPGTGTATGVPEPGGRRLYVPVAISGT